MYVYINIYIYIYIYIYMCVCVLRDCVKECVYMYVCMYVYIKQMLRVFYLNTYHRQVICLNPRCQECS